ncbi:hypothetical protein C7212DRAFT_351483 [Tuber magnatum]|uniref:Uncharacterized protein n=1 Tax=Tuber magnatum TaxID=42249 RepID=A0A317SPI2_9PEZI|nr:hypothetical protein C7212DRAFT_351483 [Tuber magnatum]
MRLLMIEVLGKIDNASPSNRIISSPSDNTPLRVQKGCIPNICTTIELCPISNHTIVGNCKLPVVPSKLLFLMSDHFTMLEIPLGGLDLYSDLHMHTIGMVSQLAMVQVLEPVNGGRFPHFRGHLTIYKWTTTRDVMIIKIGVNWSANI